MANLYQVSQQTGDARKRASAPWDGRHHTPGERCACEPVVYPMPDGTRILQHREGA